MTCKNSMVTNVFGTTSTFLTGQWTCVKIILNFFTPLLVFLRKWRHNVAKQQMSGNNWKSCKSWTFSNIHQLLHPSILQKLQKRNLEIWTPHTNFESLVCHGQKNQFSEGLVKYSKLCNGFISKYNQTLHFTSSNSPLTDGWCTGAVSLKFSITAHKHSVCEHLI